jgi:hypothetical protein
VFDNKGNQTLSLQVAATDILVIQCTRNIDQKPTHIRFCGSHNVFSVHPSEFPKVIFLAKLVARKVTNPHRFISGGSGVIGEVVWE